MAVAMVADTSPVVTAVDTKIATAGIITEIDTGVTVAIIMAGITVDIVDIATIPAPVLFLVMAAFMVIRFIVTPIPILAITPIR